jgi:peroxiredoxin
MNPRYFPTVLFFLGIILGPAWPTTPLTSAAEPPAGTVIGVKAPNSSVLRDVRGNRRALHDFKGYRAVVLAFLGTECPLSSLSLPGLIELEKRFRAQQVQFLAIYPNAHDDLDRVAAHAYDHDVPFPVLRDSGQRLADALGVSRVPTVVVLDGQFVVQYRGRMDDRYGVNFRRPKATREDLVQALDEVLAGKKVSVAATEVDGCLLDRATKQAEKMDVTFTKDVARILQQRCQSCHRPGQAAPFSLLTYEDAVRHARMLKEVTTERRMPPWHADPRYGKFANERRMTAKEVETVAAWVDAGTPRGDDKDLPQPIAWAQGWTMGQPDVVIPMPTEFAVPADGSLPYQHFFVETNYKEDRWVRLAEARPGSPGVVHHIVVYILQAGQDRPFTVDGSLAVLVGWAPGDLGLVCPPDTALRLPKGSRLLFEMHYTPNGTAVKDRSAVGITFAKEPPRFEMLLNSFANDAILVPPHDPHYKAEATFRVRADARILSFVPHMHWRGRDYRYEAIYPDGRREVLLSVPRWDFNWQSVYQFKEPVKLPEGARIHAVAHWDNTKNNPDNPAPDKAVRFGLQTWDEMMVGWVAYVWERPETAAELAKQPVSQADLIFDRMDRNGDGVITPDEISEKLRPLLLAAGGRIPERMTREEFRRLFETMRQRFPQNRPNRNPSDGDKRSAPPKGP